jgi:hypothetical protein
MERAYEKGTRRMSKCNTCNKEISVVCDWNQGRCPHRSPMLTDYHFRFYNLMQFIKGLFKRGSST